MPGQTDCKHRIIKGAAACALAILLLASATPSYAENPALDAASGALKKGKYSSALKTLNKELKNGKLNTQEMSKALFLRGLAYQAQKKPAQSIADLTNAIWMGGLSTAERAEALKYRALAFRAGGVSDRAKADQAEAARLARGLPKISQTLGTPANSATGTSQGSGGFGSGITSGISNFFGNILPGSSKPAATAPKTTAIASNNADAQASTSAANSAQQAAWSAGSTVSPAASEPRARKPKPRTSKPVVTGWSTAVDQQAKAATKPKPPASSGFGLGGVGDFFGNIFAGSSQKPSAQKPVPAPAPALAPTPTPAPALAKPTRTAALNTKKPAPVKPAQPRGTYKLQIATVRSREEASTIVSGLTARHGAVVAEHPAQIDEAVVGNMGTFYRVRLKAFNSEKTALKTCNKLRASGLDCFPVAR